MFTNDLGRRAFMLPILIISIVLLVLLTIFGSNFHVSIDAFRVFHFIMEMATNIMAASTFLLLHYIYPYENKLKYIVSGSLFLSIVTVNTMHMYYGSLNDFALQNATAGIVDILCAVTLFSFVIFPERPLKKNRWIITILPSTAIIITFLFLLSDNRGFIYFFSSLSVGGQRNSYLEVALLLIYIFTLYMMSMQYKKKRNEIYSNLILGLLLLLFSWLIGLFTESLTDLDSFVAQIYKLIGIVAIFRAYFINGIKIPYERLQEASSIKTGFIVNLSHELRTPTNVILNALKLIDAKDRNSYYIKSMEKNTQRLNKVCENIIIFNEIENGCIDVALNETDIVYMIDEILEEADSIADEKRLEITFNFESKEVVKTDSKKLQIIILNLISNAVKYAPEGGVVDITLSIKDKLELEVLNNGPIINDGEKQKIFDKFYKSQDIRLCSREGLGIGLYISKKYAEIMEGSIEPVTRENLTGCRLTIPVIICPAKSSNSNTYNVSGYFADIS